ncbi:DEAD/DEAH box helicase family protein [Leucobacter sp. Z1108]|uniref:DEAD/DEAH box helicase family protein n=1 Tax=Leucobacter sp. Z1108 TaxID=3439066 RepID=UPI003F2B5C19
MVIRWNEINPSKGAKLTRPREIYASLQGRKWPRLRPEQNEVLEKWYERRHHSDLVLKQNTGGGKTLTGLLIAQSSLHEGVGPAVFLVPDSFLIRQVVSEANEAQIPVTTDMDDESFRSSQSILVTTFHKLLNGRSAFGVRGVKLVIPLGIVVIDDAHAALAATTDLFTAFIPRSSGAFDQLLKLFAADLREQSPKSFAEIEANDFGAPMRVPPKAVADRADEMMRIVQPIANDSGIPSLFFSWPYVADLLKLAIVTVANKGIEIKTPCPDVSIIPAFSQAQRRVYLTATLADEGVLVTELDANPKTVREPITPNQASDLGDRLILAPLSINPRLSVDAIRDLARNFADGDRDGDGVAECEAVNVVVLVPSDYAAKQWSGIADLILHVKNMRPYIERMKSGEQLGVVVLVNKYDGVDLPGGACRLLIIDGVPTPLSPHEQRAAAALTGSMSFKSREVQRVEQGMGRGIRDVEDYCAVLVLTREVALTLRDTSLRQFYSPATRAQIELSLQIADQIQGEGITVMTDLLNMFLGRDPQWVAKSLEATADVTYEPGGKVTELAIGRRTAFNLAISGDTAAGVKMLRDAIDSVDDDFEKGWYLEELAGYQHFVNPTESQRTLSAAKKLNWGVLKPAVPPKYKQLTPPVVQGRSATSHLSRYTDARQMELSVSAIFDNIIWGVEQAADRAEEQFRLLGLHLGFGSSRPEKEMNDGGPDNLWALTPGHYAVIELKTGTSRPDPKIIKDDAEQITHSSMTWFQDRYMDENKATPVLVHPSMELDPQAHVPSGTRVITESHLSSLRNDVEAFIRELSDTASWRDEDAVTSALSRHRLTAEQVIASHSKLIRK